MPELSAAREPCEKRDQLRLPMRLRLREDRFQLVAPGLIGNAKFVGCRFNAVSRANLSRQPRFGRCQPEAGLQHGFGSRRSRVRINEDDDCLEGASAL